MDLKSVARDILIKGIKAVDPYSCIMNAVHFTEEGIHIGKEIYPFSIFTKILVIGGGKASARMGKAIEDILCDYISAGWINTKYGHSITLNRVHIHECGHPLPDERGPPAIAAHTGVIGWGVVAIGHARGPAADHLRA